MVYARTHVQTDKSTMAAVAKCPWLELHSTKLAAPATIFSLAHVVGSHSSRNNITAAAEERGGKSGPASAAADVPDLVCIMSPGLPVLTMECSNAPAVTTSAPSAYPSTSTSTLTMIREYTLKLPHLPDTAELISMAAFYCDTSMTTVALGIAFLHKDNNNSVSVAAGAGATVAAASPATPSSFSSAASKNSNANKRGAASSGSGAGDDKAGQIPLFHIYMCKAGLRSPRLWRRVTLPSIPFCLGSMRLGSGGEEVFVVCCGNSSTLVYSPTCSTPTRGTEPGAAAAAAAAALAGVACMSGNHQPHLASISEAAESVTSPPPPPPSPPPTTTTAAAKQGSPSLSSQGIPATDFGRDDTGAGADLGGGDDDFGDGASVVSRAQPPVVEPPPTAVTLSKDGGDLATLYSEFGAIPAMPAPTLCMDSWFAKAGNARASVIGRQDGWCVFTYIPAGATGDDVARGTSEHECSSSSSSTTTTTTTTTTSDTRRKRKSIEHQVQFRGPITVAKFFTTRNPAAGGSCKHDAVHLLVGCAVELAVVYWNVDRAGLVAPTKLAESDCYDSITCGTVTTLRDGSMEILLGTYGEQVLSYAINTPDRRRSSGGIGGGESGASADGGGSSGGGGGGNGGSAPSVPLKNAAELQWRRTTTLLSFSIYFFFFFFG